MQHNHAVQYEDLVTVPTPEGLELELSLAGVGSRFAAGLVDVLVEGLTILALVLAFQFLPAVGLGERTSTAVFVAVGSLAAFAVIFGYHVLFETLASGRSPGKRIMGLRVTRAGGAPVRFRDSAVRNLVRLVDLLPPFYGFAAASILLSPMNQRLGDLAAGTIVLREGRQRIRPGVPGAVEEDDLSTWDVSAITTDELAAVRRFLDRRGALRPAARTELAAELAERLRPRVGGVGGTPTAEQFLERLAAAKAARA